MGLSPTVSVCLAGLLLGGLGCASALPQAAGTERERCPEPSEPPAAIVPAAPSPSVAPPATTAAAPAQAGTDAFASSASPPALEPLGPVSFAEDFDWSPLEEDEIRQQAYRAIGGAVVADYSLSSSLDCAGYRATVVDHSEQDAPRAAGLPPAGALVLGTQLGQTRAVFAPTGLGMRWWLVACADLTGDGRPELVTTNFAKTLVLGLGRRVETLYEGANPFPERDADGRIVLHARDRRLHRLPLGMPGIFVPHLPTYWAFDGKRFFNRTAKETDRMRRQRERALQVAARCALADAYCDERLAAFFAGTAWLMGDANGAAAMLATEVQRKRFRELLSAVAQGARP